MSAPREMSGYDFALSTSASHRQVPSHLALNHVGAPASTTSPCSNRVGVGELAGEIEVRLDQEDRHLALRAQASDGAAKAGSRFDVGLCGCPSPLSSHVEAA